MNNLRDKIYYYAIKYDGDYFKIGNALSKHEPYEVIKNKRNHLIYGESDYPSQLYNLKYPPYILFYKGNLELLKKPMISIVGSREVDDYGFYVTKEVAKRIGNRYVIVSGMAKGCDGIAQINVQQSIGILGCGIDYIYPKCNSKLFDKVSKHGLLLSEYPLMVKPEKFHFPWRNRIIAALGEKMIVPCAKKTGGTMTSVNEALILNKMIYCIPYPINNIYGEGCNLLLESGANFILNFDDLKQI